MSQEFVASHFPRRVRLLNCAREFLWLSQNYCRHRSQSPAFVCLFLSPCMRNSLEEKVSSATSFQAINFCCFMLHNVMIAEHVVACFIVFLIPFAPPLSKNPAARCCSSATWRCCEKNWKRKIDSWNWNVAELVACSRWLSPARTLRAVWAQFSSRTAWL